eukprot:9480238-Pyramimonas_sp.AAC.1
MTCFHLNVEKLMRFVYNLSLVKPERFSPKGRPQCAHLKAEGPMKIQDNVPVLAEFFDGRSAPLGYDAYQGTTGVFTALLCPTGNHFTLFNVRSFWAAFQ